ncbi:MAG: hypothetical protein GF332_03495, partial [Candidatus Moranbacteria bacterium]|nr:hypothetical protein [Candidatus Moranbacteria bacterium]
MEKRAETFYKEEERKRLNRRLDFIKSLVSKEKLNKKDKGEINKKITLEDPEGFFLLLMEQSKRMKEIKQENQTKLEELADLLGWFDDHIATLKDKYNIYCKDIVQDKTKFLSN